MSQTPATPSYAAPAVCVESPLTHSEIQVHGQIMQIRAESIREGLRGRLIELAARRARISEEVTELYQSMDPTRESFTAMLAGLSRREPQLEELDQSLRELAQEARLTARSEAGL